MAQSLQIATKASSNINVPGDTKYAGCGQANAQTNQTVEARRQVAYRTTGTMSKLYYLTRSNSLSTAATTVRLRVAGANGNLTLSVTAAATGEFEDTSNSDSITAGNLLDYSVVVAAGGTGEIYTNAISNLYSVTGAALTRMIASGLGSISFAEETRFHGWVGTGAWNTVEDETKAYVKAAGTLKNMFAYIISNDRLSTTTFGSRVNGVTGALTLSVTGSSTGVFEDTSNTDSVTAGQYVNAYVTTGTLTAIMDIAEMSFEYSTTTGDFNFCSYGNSTAINNDPAYLGLSGILAETATENETSVKTRLALSLSSLFAYVSANAVNNTTTVRLRVTGGNGSNVLSILTTQTGAFRDTSNTDSASSTATLNYSVEYAGTAGVVFDLFGISARAVSGPSGMKTFDGLATASIKNIDSLAIASVKTVLGLA